jgi:hypothetical protein
MLVLAGAVFAWNEAQIAGHLRGAVKPPGVLQRSDEGTRHAVEPVVAKREPRPPAVVSSLMEAVCERENLKPDYLRAHWPRHRLQPIFDPTFSDYSYGFRPGGRRIRR